jgi:hypothetical protein
MGVNIKIAGSPHVLCRAQAIGFVNSSYLISSFIGAANKRLFPYSGSFFLEGATKMSNFSSKIIFSSGGVKVKNPKIRLRSFSYDSHFCYILKFSILFEICNKEKAAKPISAIELLFN